MATFFYTKYKFFYPVILCLSGVFLFPATASAQIFAPDLQCIKADTLFWDLPVNTCGSFNSYDIYWSNNPDGPYALLVNITNISQTAYYDPNPTGDLRYYFMRSNYNCPGQPALSSDTLDNLPPAAVTIDIVTVNGPQVDIYWQPSSSPEVEAYIIYRETNIGLLPIDTVTGTTTYSDLNADPLNQSEAYTVLALDPCGSTSIFDLSHHTIFLEVTPSSCEQTFSLTWNLYNNWPGGIRRHEIWMSTNGSNQVMLDTATASATSYTIENINDGDTYCILVKAVGYGAAYNSESNKICLTADIVQPMRNLVVTNIGLNSANQTIFQWSWDTNAEINTVNIYSSADGLNFTSLNTASPVFPLVQHNTFLDNINMPGLGNVWYRIETLDDCDSVATSNTAATVFLTGTPFEDRTNVLSWTPYENSKGTLLSYDIFRYVGNSGAFLGNVDAATTSYTDTITLSNPAEAYTCYAVVAKALVDIGGTNPYPVETRSNTICVEQFADLLVPNAFSPRGYNQEFKPLIVFGDKVTLYELAIYDRWGKRLFLSEDPAIGWNGENTKGEDLPFGIYTWHIRMVQENGRVVDKTGVVTLVR
jgi:hypothetical protein